MPDLTDKESARIFTDIAERNAKAALKFSAETRAVLDARLNELENLVKTLAQQVALQDHKYNLLLTKNFNGGSTSGS